MIFNSFVFFAFFVVVLLAYRALPFRGQNTLLLIASYIFYGYWDWRFLSLIFASTLVDYLVGRWLVRENDDQRRRRIITISVVMNLLFLGFFKYFGFFAQELNHLLLALGMNDSLPVLKVVLPVGISFYTFQSMSYTLDVYRRTTVPADHFADFCLYVSFFPQLVAGPIERSGHLLKQVIAPRPPMTTDMWREGLYLILFGMFKKVVVADNAATIANHVFNNPAQNWTALEVLIGIYAFAFQIYGDFAGYSNIAQGTAKLLGFELSWNFRLPYFALSPSDFWKRWHISLSSWLRDYLYIPLGGNRKGPVRTYINLFLTMLLGGLWHGAAWTFLFWGALHGALLTFFRKFLPGVPELSSANEHVSAHRSRYNGLLVLQAIVFFQFICLTWLLFRAQDMAQVWAMLAALGGSWQLTDFARFGFGMLAFYVLPLFIYEGWLERRGDQLAILDRPWPVQAALYSYLLLMLLLFPPLAAQSFIYFQF